MRGSFAFFCALGAATPAWAMSRNVVAASSGFQNLISTVCWISGLYFTVSGIVHLVKLWKMEKSAEGYEKTLRKMTLYPIMGAALLAFPFIQAGLQANAHANWRAPSQISAPPMPYLPPSAVAARCCPALTRKQRAQGTVPAPHCTCVNLGKPLMKHQYWEDSARKGDVAAQLNLARYYYDESTGHADDLRESIYWWKEAARAGSEEAQRWLSEHAPEASEQEAERWLLTLAKKGDFEAQAGLGRFYRRRIVFADLVNRRDRESEMESYFWFKVAMAHRHCMKPVIGSISHEARAKCPLVAEHAREQYDLLDQEQIKFVAARLRAWEEFMRNKR